MSEWKTMRDAPIGEPVKVWCNILGGPPGDDREWTAIQKHRGWWQLHGRNGGRIHPTHWKPLPTPPKP